MHARLPAPPEAALVGAGRRGDRVFRLVSVAAAALVILALAGVVVQLLSGSAQALGHFGLGFVTGQTWDASIDTYSALPFIAGTVVSSLGAMLIAVPVGVATALVLSEMASRRIAVPLTFLVELIAAIPSVVIGLWGLAVLSTVLRDVVEVPVVDTFGSLPVLGSAANGSDLLAATLLLALMITPTIVAITREVLATVPQSHREAFVGLGATRWETIRAVVLPQARAGIVGAALLALARALGETMAVTMTIGNADVVPSGLFDPAQTIASKLATSWPEAIGDLQVSSLMALGFVLMLMSVAIVLATRLLVRGSRADVARP